MLEFGCWDKTITLTFEEKTSRTVESKCESTGSLSTTCKAWQSVCPAGETTTTFPGFKVSFSCLSKESRVNCFSNNAILQRDMCEKQQQKGKSTCEQLSPKVHWDFRGIFSSVSCLSSKDFEVFEFSSHEACFVCFPSLLQLLSLHSWRKRMHRCVSQVFILHLHSQDEETYGKWMSIIV